jgi:hypothetical protein
MFSSSVMRTVVLVASLASLPLFVSAAPVSSLEIFPDGSMVERTIEEREAYAGRPNGTSEWVTERSWDEYENGQLVRRAGTNYILDCKDYPEVRNIERRPKFELITRVDLLKYLLLSALQGRILDPTP